MQFFGSELFSDSHFLGLEFLIRTSHFWVRNFQSCDYFGLDSYDTSRVIYFDIAAQSSL